MADYVVHNGSIPHTHKTDYLLPHRSQTGSSTGFDSLAVYRTVQLVTDLYRVCQDISLYIYTVYFPPASQDALYNCQVGSVGHNSPSSGVRAPDDFWGAFQGVSVHVMARRCNWEWIGGGSGRGLTCGIIPTFTWSNSGKIWNPDNFRTRELPSTIPICRILPGVTEGRYEIRITFVPGNSQAQFQYAGFYLE